MSAIPLAELAWLAAAVIAAGIVSGILAGVFGIGGGAVIVPVLFECFRLFGVPDTVRMQLCVGTSMAIILPTAWRSYQAHRARGLVVPEVLRLWAVPAILGVAAGSLAAAVAPAGVFEVAFVVVAGIIAAKMLLGRESWIIDSELPGRVPMRIYGFVMGLASSLMGISGGSLVTIILTLYRKTIHQAVATASGIGVPITIAGTIGYALAGLPHQSLLPPLSIGFVSVIGVVMMAPISSYVAPLGARLAHRLSRRWLEIAFGLFLVLVSARFVVSLLYPGT
ncbi:MAG: sulfite exporter TauE/SafE family protein [Alphaproteobacteria bacterium]|nr:sulfite exporter TauE/SafE family protein [Alphaproteobacteria bacterium]